MESLLQSSIYNRYPAFSPNQVLTDTQLNHLRDYLDQQNRLTRIRTIGCGIICGLKGWHVYTEDGEGQDFVRIAEGYGITSSGFLLELKADVGKEYVNYTHYRKYEMVDVDGDELEDNHWLQGLLAEGVEVLQLINQTEDQKGLGISKQDANKAWPIDRGMLLNKALILLLKKAEEELDPCVLTACNNQGNNIAYTVVPILVPKAKVEIEKESVDPIFSKSLHIPSLATGIKLAFIGASAKAREVIDDCVYSVLFKGDSSSPPLKRLSIAYGCVVENMRKELIKRLVEGYARYKKLLNLKLDIETLRICLKDQLSKTKDGGYTQYYYDYVRDLACAWNEFLRSVNRMTLDCFSGDHYPCHLTLGTFIHKEGDAMECTLDRTNRSLFEPAPATHVLYGELERSRRLFLRMTSMIGTFSENIAMKGNHDFSKLDVDFNFPTAVTLSQKEHFDLGERAVPFYYPFISDPEKKKAFEAYWQPKMRHTIDPLLHYYRLVGRKEPSYGSMPDSYETRILDYAHHKHTFFRIEGHVHTPIKEVYQALKDQRRLHNLDFSILIAALELDDTREHMKGQGATIDSFKNVAKTCCGMIHMGGVPVGGTFILVVDDKHNVKADFAVEGCCECGVIETICPEIEEIQYEWNWNSNQSELIVNFTVVLKNGSNTPEKLSWDFGDGATMETTQLTIDHTYKVGNLSGFTAKVTTQGPKNCKGFGEVFVEVPYQKIKEDPIEESTRVPQQTQAGEEQYEERRGEYLRGIITLNSDGSFRGNKTFQAVADYLGQASMTASKNSEGFADIVDRTLTQINRKSTSQPKRLAYKQMLEKSWQRYADILVHRSDKKLSQADKTTLDDAIGQMKDAGLNLKQMAKNWQTKEIAASDTGKQILKMMK